LIRYILTLINSNLWAG